jgi:hypothetical protein
MANTRLKRSRLFRHAIFANSSHDASRPPVYRTPSYERNHSQEAAGQKDARHDGQHDSQAPIQAIIGSEVIPPVKPELFRERKELGICNRSAAFRHHRGDFCLAGLRSRGCAEPISAAHRKLSASTTIWRDGGAHGQRRDRFRSLTGLPFGRLWYGEPDVRLSKLARALVFSSS